MADMIDDYLAALDGWQAELAASLGGQILAVDGIAESGIQLDHH